MTSSTSCAAQARLRRSRGDCTSTPASFRTLRVRERETVEALRRRSMARAHPELDAPWVTPHVARRTFVTDAIERGWLYERTAAAAGQSDPGTSRRIYREPRPDVIDLGWRRCSGPHGAGRALSRELACVPAMSLAREELVLTITTDLEPWAEHCTGFAEAVRGMKKVGNPACRQSTHLARWAVAHPLVCSDSQCPRRRMR